MPESRWLEIVEELCQMGVDVFQISGGGEPMMRADLTLKVMELIQKWEKVGRLVTNGTIWKSDWIERVVKMGWAHVIFSLDGPDAATQDASRGVKGTFRKNLKVIRLFTEYKRRWGCERPRLEFSTVLTKLNYRRIDGVIRLAHRLGVENITIEPVFITHAGAERLRLDRRQRVWFLGHIDELKELARICHISVNLDSLVGIQVLEKTGHLREKILSEVGERTNNEFLNLPCFEPWLWPKIEAHGEVGPCSSLFLTHIHGREISVLKESFCRMWYGEVFGKFRMALLRGKLCEECANCVSTHIPTNKLIRDELRRRLGIKR
jgi:MoaA/NifB/PqqE/SkfB family radical SAM enzyme